MYKVEAFSVPGQEIPDVCLDFMQPSDARRPVGDMRFPSNAKISTRYVGVSALNTGRDEPSSPETKIKDCRVLVLRKQRSIFVRCLLHRRIIILSAPRSLLFGEADARSYGGRLRQQMRVVPFRSADSRQRTKRHKLAYRHQHFRDRDRHTHGCLKPRHAGARRPPPFLILDNSRR